MGSRMRGGTMSNKVVFVSGRGVDVLWTSNLSNNKYIPVRYEQLIVLL